MKLNFKRGAVAMAAVLACLLTFQSPASATVYDATISDGTVTLSKTGATPAVISLAPSGAGCPAGTLQADITTTTANVTAISSQGFFTLGTGSFVSVITRTNSTTGAISGTSVTGVGVSVSATIYTAGANCTTGTRVCGFTANLVFAGTITGVSSSNTGTLSAPAANLTVSGSCLPPFVTYLGGQVTVTDLDFHLT